MWDDLWLTIFVVAIVAIIAVIALGVVHQERTQMPKAYAAWVKQTDNPKGLSYDEWRSLMRANERRQALPTFIFMPGHNP